MAGIMAAAFVFAKVWLPKERAEAAVAQAATAT
jgi:hypothetical protein